MLTEFGSHGVPDVNSPESVDSLECESILQEMDARLASWTYWNTYGLFEGPDFIEDSARQARPTNYVPRTPFPHRHVCKYRVVHLVK